MKGPALALVSLGMVHLSGAAENCEPNAPATCYSDSCDCVYCLGPANAGVNAPARPFTCNGDLSFTLSGLYWKAEQDGMEYAVETNAIPGGPQGILPLINADFKNPKFHWDFGFQLGIGYNTTCDGWDIGLLWTRFTGDGSAHNQVESDENSRLIVLWSNDLNVDFTPAMAATDIKADWGVKINLVDLSFGRWYWNSHKLALHPHIGVRISYLDQDYSLLHKGGSWAEDNLNNEVHLDNDFKGVGIRAGLDTNWHLGCGWRVFGNFALAQAYGRFDVKHREQNREAASPFEKISILETKDHFKESSLMMDFELGLAYFALLCDCDYAIEVSLGWEQHLFLDQNQMWRVVPFLGPNVNLTSQGSLYSQRRGNLSTEGWTLKAEFFF